MSQESVFGPWPGDGEGATQPTDDTGPTTEAIVTEIDGGIPFWEEAPDLWDAVTIAGFTFPGVASVGGEPKRKLDKKNAKGADGRTITDDGADGVDVEVIIRIWTKEQWINYQNAVPFIDPNQQKGRLEPVDIIHPALKLHGVKSIYVESMTIPTPTSTPQMKEVRIKATSWAPAPKKPKKSKSTTPNSSNGDASGTARKSLGETGTQEDYQDELDLLEAEDIDQEYAEWLEEQRAKYGDDYEPGDDP